MLYDVISVEHIRDYILKLRFEDGVEGEVDVSRVIPFLGVFEPLQNLNEFKKVRVEQGTIVWESGADLSPEFLYDLIAKNSAG